VDHGWRAGSSGKAATAKPLRSFKQAQEAARTWWRLAERREQGIAPDDGPYTVARALDAYFGDRERRGSKGLAKDRAAANVRILPALGDVELAKLTTKRIRDWHTGLASASKLVRTGRIVKKAWKSHSVDTKDADAVRARRATANRTLTVLREIALIGRIALVLAASGSGDLQPDRHLGRDEESWSPKRLTAESGHDTRGGAPKCVRLIKVRVHQEATNDSNSSPRDVWSHDGGCRSRHRRIIHESSPCRSRAILSCQPGA
jgi:hypothetical protein